MSAILELAKDVSLKRQLLRGSGIHTVEERLAALEREVARLTDLARFFTFPQKPSPVDNINRIKVLVSTRLGVTLQLIEGTVRDAGVVWARHVAIYLIHEVHQYTFSDIARNFRPRNRRAMDRCTVHHAVQAVHERIQSQLPARAMVASLLEEAKAQ